MKRGAFIVFEGIDRCGKSTQIKKLADYLTERGHNIVCMRFPERSTPIGQTIDAYLKNTTELDDKTLHQMFCKNRWEFNDSILRDLTQGKTIIADRYAYSGVAYSAAKGIDLEWCKEGDIGLTAPDKVFFMDMDVLAATKRGNYGEERYEKREFQEKVRNVFHSLAKESNWFKVDATLPMDEIHDIIRKEALTTMESSANSPINKLWTKSSS